MEAVFSIWPASKLYKEALGSSRAAPVQMMTIMGLLDYWRFGVEFTVSQQLLWLRHGDSSETQREGNVRHWKQLPEDW
jgi:hypothetical protein